MTALGEPLLGWCVRLVEDDAALIRLSPLVFRPGAQTCEAGLT